MANKLTEQQRQCEHAYTSTERPDRTIVHRCDKCGHTYTELR